MYPRLPNLIWLRAFEAAERLGSFTAAAEELGLTQAAVSHQVRSLEQSLGFPLFIRQTRSLVLTEMGRAYLPSIRKAIDDIALSTQGLFGPKTRKIVTIRVPISTAVLFLAPRLKDFRKDYPEVGVRMISAIWADSIRDDNLDIDIRLGPANNFSPGARLLSRETAVPICSPKIAAQITCAADLLRHDLIHIMGFQDHWARYFKSIDPTPFKPDFHYAVDTSLAAVEMVSSNAGVALVLKRFAADLVAAGRAAIPLKKTIDVEQGHYLERLEKGRAKPAEVRLLEDWLVEIFG